MNKHQKVFLKSLLKTIEQAKDTQASILQALEIGVSNKVVCLEYIQALQQYINDAQRMAMQCTMAYGKG